MPHNPNESTRATELGRYLYDTRMLKGKSLAQAGHGAGCSASYVQKLEQGKVDQPSPSTLRGLAASLGCDYLELMLRAGYLDGIPTMRPAPREPRYARDWNDAVARIPAGSEDGNADINVCHGMGDSIVLDWPLDVPAELTIDGARLLGNVLTGLAAANTDARDRRIRRNMEARRV